MPYFNNQRQNWMGQVSYMGKKQRRQFPTRTAALEWEIMKKKELLGQVLESPPNTPTQLQNSEEIGHPVPVVNLSALNFLRDVRPVRTAPVRSSALKENLPAVPPVAPVSHQQVLPSDPQGVLLPTRTVSLGDFANRYLDWSHIMHSRKTYEEKKAAFRRFFRSFDPSLDTSLLHSGSVLTYLASQAKHRSGYAANKDRKNLVAAWNWGKKYLLGFPPRNPFLVDRFPEKRCNRYVPPEKDFWAVYDSAELDQDRVMLLCYLHLAARRSEVFRIKLEDVDLVSRQIRLFTRKRKGGSEHSDWLPLTDRLADELSRHLLTISGPWLFPDPKTGEPYVSRQKWLPRLCEKAAVKPFGLHGIRHLAASILVNSGVALSLVQRILRHQKVTTTERYVHCLVDVRNATRAFD